MLRLTLRFSHTQYTSVSEYILLEEIEPRGGRRGGLLSIRTTPAVVADGYEGN